MIVTILNKNALKKSITLRVHLWPKVVNYVHVLGASPIADTKRYIYHLTPRISGQQSARSRLTVRLHALVSGHFSYPFIRHHRDWC
jgi:hypothetical protein